ncbi:FecR family protein [Alteromonadaceae bacterium Bs31]|nr:FecR family protein [Alteromonadaceae bacterium Bs31]
MLYINQPEQNTKSGLGLKSLLLFFLALFSAVPASAEDWIYTVRPGDTLWDLCLEYTTEKGCWQKIGPYNEVDFPPSLAPGTRIKFPMAWLKTQPVNVELLFIYGDVQVEIPGKKQLSAGSMSLGETSISDLRNREESEQKPYVGMELPVGTSVSTGADGSASLKFADGSVLVLDANSKIILDLLSQHNSTGMVDSRIRLLQGSTRSKVQKRSPRSHFSVSSPSAVAAVRGTEFNFVVPDEQSSATLSSVFEGNIAVTQEDKTHKTNSPSVVEIPAGYGIRIKKGEALASPTPLLAAPEINKQAVYALPLELEWQAVDAAQSYRFQLLEDTEQDKLLRTLSISEPALSLSTLDSGCYKAQISAIDKNDLVGMPNKFQFCAEQAPSRATLLQAKLSKKTLSLQWQFERQPASTRIELFHVDNLQEPIYSETTVGNSFEYSLDKRQQIYAKVCGVGDYGLEGECTQSEILGEKSKAWHVFLLMMLAVIAGL